MNRCKTIDDFRDADLYILLDLKSLFQQTPCTNAMNIILLESFNEDFCVKLLQCSLIDVPYVNLKLLQLNGFHKL